MLKDDFMEKIFAHEDMQRVPIGVQSTVVHALDDILEDMLQEKPEAKIRELMVQTKTTKNGGKNDIKRVQPHEASA